jgi:predicted alpha/beta hydrolase family esterase
MQKTAFIIHGSYGNPQENWFPWLKNKLKKLDFEVFVPQFPIPAEDNQNSAWGGHNLQEWLNKLSKYSKYITNKTIFIAHSRGCILTYHFLSKLSSPIAGTFLVAPWINYHWYPKGWKEVDSFHVDPFDWIKIKQGSKYFEVYQSTNDDTPLSEGKELAQKLGAKLKVVDNAGHFNTKAGYDSFPLLFENIEFFAKSL